MLKTGAKCSFIIHKLHSFTCFCLTSAASEAFHNDLPKLHLIIILYSRYHDLSEYLGLEDTALVLARHMQPRIRILKPPQQKMNISYYDFLYLNIR